MCSESRPAKINGPGEPIMFTPVITGRSASPGDTLRTFLYTRGRIHPPLHRDSIKFNGADFNMFIAEVSCTVTVLGRSRMHALLRQVPSTVTGVKVTYLALVMFIS